MLELFEHMKMRYFLLASMIVFVVTLVFLGGDLEHPVKEVIFVYVTLGIFPIVWFGYYLEKQGYRFSDLIQTTGIKPLAIPLGVIFIVYFALALGVVWFSSFVLSFISPDYVEYFLSDEDLLPKGRPIAAFFLAIYIGIIGPIAEELIFRGLLLNRISYKLNLKYGIMISSFIFAIFHFDIIGSFITGVILSFVYIWTKNLLYPILLHIANNCLVVFLVIFNIELPKFFIYTTVQDVQAVTVPNIIIIIVFAPLLVFVLYKYRPLFLKEQIKD